MIPNLLRQPLIVAAAFLEGFLSMGFQLVATRVIAPFFGSTLIVWAFVISTFLAAFSIGAILGGACSRFESMNIQRSMGLIGVAGVAGFVMTAEFGHRLMVVMDHHVHGFLFGLGLACVILFLLPIVALSAMLPIFTEVLVKGGNKGGLSSGLVYGVSTLGNIFGVMATAFFLIPRWHTSAILAGWAVGAAICFYLFSRAVKVVMGQRATAKAYGLQPPADVAGGAQR